MNDKKAIIAGFICLDIRIELSSSPQELDNALPLERSPIQIRKSYLRAGGLLPEVGFALYALGLPVTLVGKIGDDQFGAAVKNIVEQKAPQLLSGLTVDPSTPTGYRIFLNSVYYFPGANNTFYASDIRRDVLREADLFHFGYPSLMRSIYRGDGGELVSILQRVRREGLSASLDFGLPDPHGGAGNLEWPIILANTLPLADIFVPDIEQLLFSLKPDHYQQLKGKNPSGFSEAVSPDFLFEMSEWILGYGVKILLVDMGQRGLYLRTNKSEAWQKVGRGLSGLGQDWYGREMWLPAINVKNVRYSNPHSKVVAGLIAGLLKDNNPERSLILSAAARAAAIETAGDLTNLPAWNDLRITTGGDREIIALQLEKFGFREGSNGIWER